MKNQILLAPYSKNEKSNFITNIKFKVIVLFTLFPFLLKAQLIERDVDKLVIGNDIIKREICIKGRQFFTQSIKTSQSDRNFAGNNSSEFSFLLNGMQYDGRSGWDLASVLERKNNDRGDGVEIKLTNHDLQLDVVLLYVFYHDLPIIKKRIGFINRSSQEMLLENLNVEKLITSMSRTLSALYSSFGRQKHLSTYFGDHDDAVCMVHQYSINSGILFANEAPGVLKKMIYNTALNDISVGLSDKNSRYPFAKYIAPGEEWNAPPVVILPYSDKMDPWAILNNKFADYQRKYAGFALFENRNRRLSFMYNTWFPLGENLDEKKILDLVEAAAQCGMKQFTIDAGWFTTKYSQDNRWIYNCGDWIVDKKKFPRGLKPVFERMHSLGIKPGLWVAVSTASEWSEVFRSHPEWGVLDSKGEPTSIYDGNRHVRSMCMATKWKQYIKEKLAGMVQEYGIRYFKLDLAAATSAYIMETEKSGCYATNHPGHKDHAESYIAIYTGLFQLFDELHQRFPDLYIDCVFETEGKMQAIDYAFRKHADGNWLSNFEEPYPIGSLRVRNLAWWRSPAMPASSMLIGNRRIDIPEGIDELRGLMGTFPIVLGDLRTLPPERREELKRWSDWIIELRNKYDYDLYRRDLPGFGEPIEGSWDGYARINTDTKRGGIIGIFRQGAPDDRRTVFVEGLIPDKTYAVKPDPSVLLPVRYFTGKALAETGFEVCLEKKYEGRLFEIELVVT